MLNYEDCSLRPLAEVDLGLVLEWRNTDRIRSCMFNNHMISWEEHLNWYRKISSQTSSVHLIFEYKQEPVGTVNVTNIDHDNKRCYWGFYVGKHNTPAGTGLVLGFMGLDYIFDRLSLHKTCSEVFLFNLPSVKYHAKLGFKQEGLFREHIWRDGKFEDVACLALFEWEWRAKRPMVAQFCFGGDINA